MTIEQLAEQATDQENFSHEGEVVVEITDGQLLGMSAVSHVTESGERARRIPVSSASYNPETKQLILHVARQEQGT